MKAIDATRILLTRKKTTGKLRRQCARARETTMQSATPIYAEKVKGKPTEYYSSKPLEATADQRFALKLRRATLAQLIKWYRRNQARQTACSGIVSRIPEDSKRRQKFAALATHHAKIADACCDEIYRRQDEVKKKAENV